MWPKREPRCLRCVSAVGAPRCSFGRAGLQTGFVVSGKRTIESNRIESNGSEVHVGDSALVRREIFMYIHNMKLPFFSCGQKSRRNFYSPAPTTAVSVSSTVMMAAVSREGTGTGCSWRPRGARASTWGSSMTTSGAAWLRWRSGLTPERRCERGRCGLFPLLFQGRMMIWKRAECEVRSGVCVEQTVRTAFQ